MKSHGFFLLLQRLKSLSWLSFLSGIVVTLGFLRELYVAHQYGISAELDLFIAVSSVYLFLGIQFGNGLETTIISQQGGGVDVNGRSILLSVIFAEQLVISIVALAITLTFFGEGFELLFPKMSETHSQSALKLMYGFSVSIVFASIAGLMRGILASQRIFSPGVIAGGVVSLSSIISMSILSESEGVYALVVGIMVGNFLLVMWYSVLLNKNGIFNVLNFSNCFIGISVSRKFWMAFVIVMASEIVWQIYSLLERSIAADIEVGAVSTLFYAASIVMVPLALVITPLVTIIYPKMVTVFSSDRSAGARMLMRYSVTLFMASATIATLISMFASEIVQLVFMRGEFSLQSSERTGRVLAVISMSLPFLAVSRLIRNGSYSIHDYATPVLVNIAKVAVLLMSSLFLVPPYGVIGLAWSTVVASALGVMLSIGVLMWKLRHG